VLNRLAPTYCPSTPTLIDFSRASPLSLFEQPAIKGFHQPAVRQSRNRKGKMDITTKEDTKSTKEENVFLSDSMSSPLSGLRVLRDLHGEKALRRMAHS